jgi:transposase
MSRRELRRVEVLARVQAEELKLIDAASLMGVSYRQAKRIGKRYREEGAEGMKHRSAGRRSSRAKPEKFRREVLGLVRRKYSGEEGRRFGPTLAAEHLSAEDGLAIDAETLRRWMLAEGLWSRERKRQQHRQRRERKPHFGELVQMDGSFHDWLEGRGPRGCLMDMVDDATGATLGRLGEEETIWAAVRTLRAWIERYGVPQAIYVDWKNLYKRAPTSRELLRGEEPVTQFGRMCAKLGIRIIAASSAQAKGRVERNHARHAPGSVDQKDAAQKHLHTRAGESISRTRIFAGTQPALHAAGGSAGRLSRQGAGGSGVAKDFSFGKRAHGQQRRGGALRQPLVPVAAAEPARRAGAS